MGLAPMLLQALVLLQAPVLSQSREKPPSDGSGIFGCSPIFCGSSSGRAEVFLKLRLRFHVSSIRGFPAVDPGDPLLSHE